MRERGLTSEKTETVDRPENRDGMESYAGKRLLVSPLLFGEEGHEAVQKLDHACGLLGSGQS